MSFLFDNYFWWLILHSRAFINFQWNVIQYLAWSKNSLPLCNISWFRLPKQTGSSVCVAFTHITSSSFLRQKLKSINDVLDWKYVIFVLCNFWKNAENDHFNHPKHHNVKNVNPPQKKLIITELQGQSNVTWKQVIVCYVWETDLSLNYRHSQIF